MACTWPSACNTQVVHLPCTNRARKISEASRTASGGPTRRMAMVSLTALSSWSDTRTTMPCCSTSSANAGSEGASSGSSSSSASTVSSKSLSASSRTASAASRAAAASSSPRAPAVPAVRRTVRWPKCARTPCPCATERSLHLAQACRSGCRSSCGKTTAPSARAAWSSGSSPLATLRSTSAATVRFFAAPRMKIFTGAEDSPSSSTTWRWPWKKTSLPFLLFWCFATSNWQPVALQRRAKMLPSGPTTSFSWDSGTSTDQGASCFSTTAIATPRGRVGATTRLPTVT
mmetsp:Transcript_56349/g.123717  ORF Transcript_56349/g.123717 Transcript_56349/m.123717 type:complete len:288 (+) Transcript_56349:409-1272(+)